MDTFYRDYLAREVLPSPSDIPDLTPRPPSTTNSLSDPHMTTPAASLLSKVLHDSCSYLTTTDDDLSYTHAININDITLRNHHHRGSEDATRHHHHRLSEDSTSSHHSHQLQHLPPHLVSQHSSLHHNQARSPEHILGLLSSGSRTPDLMEVGEVSYESDYRMDTKLLGDVSSSSEVPLVAWQSPMDQSRGDMSLPPDASIKQEDDVSLLFPPQTSTLLLPPGPSSSPHRSHSPTTTAYPSEVYRPSPPSPSSPDTQFCSSTTPLGGDAPPMGLIEEEDAPRRTCLVCGDVASGFHYGVASCEACKAFFKRTIQGNIEYTCPANKDCEINKKRRKACQACRFAKCLAVGMLKEGVRLDRVRGGRQKYRRTSEPFGGPRRASTDVDVKMLSLLRSCEPERSTADLNTADLRDVGLLTSLADFYDRELVATIGWAKQVPGFSSVVLEDQMRLLQATWGELLTAGLAFRSMGGRGRLFFAQRLVLDDTNSRDCHATDMYLQVMAVVERFERMALQQDEFLLLKAMVLSNADVQLNDPQGCSSLRQQFVSSLRQLSELSRPSDSHFSAILLSLPALRSADAALRRFWLSVRSTDTVPMNKLFLEMLETP